MKKIIATAGIVLASVVSNAQDADPYRVNEILWEVVVTTKMVLTVVLFSIVILTFIKLILDYRIKNKLIDKGASDSVISQLLQPAIKDNSQATIKWIAILTGVGLGLSLVAAFQPLGIHSLAIMSFSLAASFLAYYFFINHKSRQ